jgi:hypothetical protein
VISLVVVLLDEFAAGSRDIGSCFRGEVYYGKTLVTGGLKLFDFKIPEGNQFALKLGI